MINRFIEAQNKKVDGYSDALNQITNGKKKTHWIWYVFLQLKSLGYSPTAKYYGIEDLDEAKAYLDNELLKNRLIEICNALLLHKRKPIKDILGTPDDMKVLSCMTLFHYTNPNILVFKQVIDYFYNGQLDHKTLVALKSETSS